MSRLRSEHPLQSTGGAQVFDCGFPEHLLRGYFARCAVRELVGLADASRLGTPFRSFSLLGALEWRARAAVHTRGRGGGHADGAGCLVAGPIERPGPWTALGRAVGAHLTGDTCGG